MPTPGSKWAVDPRGPYIRMHSGAKFYLADPTPDQFRVSDIAFHLARVNRYTGATTFSVAQHLVVGSWMAARFYSGVKLLPARVLIHDVAEHAYGDVSAPLKSLLPEYKRYEHAAEAAVEQRFDLTYLDEPLVKEVDDRMWLTERLMVYGHVEDDISEDYEGDLLPFPLERRELDHYFRPWEPNTAAYHWLEELRSQIPWAK